MSRTQHWFTLAEAVHKVTGKPAARFGISRRGLLREGYVADIVLFDPEAIGSDADYENPERLPAGIHAVFRNGESLNLVQTVSPSHVN